MNVYQHRLAHDELTEQQVQQLAEQQQQQQYLWLDFDTRQRSRFRATTVSGTTVAVDLPRTGTLKDGDVIQAENGAILQVFSAPQTLVQVTAHSPFELMKSAYHLGNRHVPLMLTEQALYFEPDYVLEEMLHLMGVHTTHLQAKFEPETGAYQSHGGHHHHHHGHGHHGHHHEHDHHHHDDVM